MRQDVPALKTFHPTEANAIDYHRKTGHQLKAHVDDRQLSTGEIATLSLQVLQSAPAGVCLRLQALICLSGGLQCATAPALWWTA